MSQEMPSDDAEIPLITQLAVPADQLEAWKVSTYKARAAELVLRRFADPVPGSPLAVADNIYRWEKASAWAHGYLRAAAEQLCFWSDIVAPYEFEPGATRPVKLRPYLLLGRSGLEAAAQGLWLLTSQDADECVSRLCRAMHRDFSLHIKALEADGRDTALVAERISNLKSRAAALTPPATPGDTPPGHEKLVRLAAIACGEDENQWAYYWNAASGAAHGQNWFSAEGFDLLYKEEYEPGHFRVITVPDPQFVTETLSAAATALTHAASRWIQFAGHPLSAFAEAMIEIHARMPKIEPADD